MYAPSAWTPLPTGHGLLGLASLKKGQVTPTVRADTNTKPFSKFRVFIFVTAYKARYYKHVPKEER